MDMKLYTYFNAVKIESFFSFTAGFKIGHWQSFNNKKSVATLTMKNLDLQFHVFLSIHATIYINQ